MPTSAHFLGWKISRLDVEYILVLKSYFLGDSEGSKIGCLEGRSEIPSFFRLNTIEVSRKGYRTTDSVIRHQKRVRQSTSVTSVDRGCDMPKRRDS